MADDKKTPQVEMPANRMRLSEKFQKLKNNINLYTHTEHTEDKGADTQVMEAENNGKIVARFVQKDGVTIESMGSDDAQQSGDFDAIAKKVGAKDGVTHTKPEQVSEIAHDNQPKSVSKDNAKADKVTKPKVDDKLDNNQESDKASEFINNKAPKEQKSLEKSGMHYSTGAQSIAYDRGGVPQAPKMQKAKVDCGLSDEVIDDIQTKNKINYKDINNMPTWKKTMMAGKKKKPVQPVKKATTLDYSKINKIPDGESNSSPSLNYKKMAEQQPVEKNPMWKQKMIKLQGELNPKKPRGVVMKLASSEEPLQKKWQVFMDSCKSQFADPLKKDPMSKGDVVSFKPKEKPTQSASGAKVGDHIKILTDKHSGNVGKEGVVAQVGDKVTVKFDKPYYHTERNAEFDHIAFNHDDHGKSWKIMSGSDKKISDALKAQEKTNPYASERTEYVQKKHGTPDVDPRYQARLNEQQGIKTKAPVAVAEKPKEKKHLQLLKSMSRLAKGDVIEFKKPEDGSQVPNTAEKMERIKDTVKRMAEKKGWNKTNPAVDEEGVPFKFWGAYRKQEEHKRRVETGHKLPKPGEEEKDNVLPMKKATVVGAAKSPTQQAGSTPTIKNAAETTVATKPVARTEGLVKEAPKVDPKSMPQHLPSAEGGLEAHLKNLTAALKANQDKLLAAQSKTAYGKDVSKDQRDREIKMADRALKYLKTGIEMTKVAIAARDSDSPKWSDLIGAGNPKVNHMGILTFGNTLPGHNCPARGGCGDGSCYGMNGQQAMGGPLVLRARNSGLIQRKDFVQGAIQALKNAPKHLSMTIDPETFEQIKDHPRFKQISLADPIVTDKGVKIKVKTGDYVRWHDTGDILNEKHLDDIVQIAKAFPEKKFYAYTKSLHLPLDKLRALPNFNVIQSLGGKHNDSVDSNKPHAKFFDDLNSAEGAGYTPVWYNDWPAATGVNNIALVPHGSRKGEIKPEEYNKPEVQPVKKSVAPGSGSPEPAWMTFDQPDSVAQSYAMGLKGKLRAMSMVNHKHDETMAKSDARANPLTGNVLQKDKPKIEIVPHPPEVIDVDPEILSNMNRRLKEPSNVSNIFRAKLGKKATDMDVKREEARSLMTQQNAKEANAKPSLRVVKSTTLGKFEALSKANPIKFSVGADKLRELRDLVESKGGVLHSKDIKHLPQFRGLKLGSLIDNKGYVTTQSLQSNIDASAQHEFETSHDQISGTSEHSPAHPDHPHHGAYQQMYGDTGDLIAKQLHSDEPSQVFQLNLSPKQLKALQESGVHDTFQKFNETSLHSSHPVHPGDGIGWVRYTEKPDGVFIDEIQSDLGSSPERSFETQANQAVESGAISPDQVESLKAQMQAHMPEEHRQVINKILFGDKHPATVLHEAFHEHLRRNGKAGKPVHIWSAAGKGSISLNDPGAPEPVHMKVTYDQNPAKMGYEPAKYGELSTQTGPHAGKPTNKTILKKESNVVDIKTGKPAQTPEAKPSEQFKTVDDHHKRRLDRMRDSLAKINQLTREFKRKTEGQ